MAIVRDEGVRDPELGDNVFSKKFLSVHISDVRQRFSFNPLSEIVCADQQIFLVTCCFGKGPTISKPHCAKGQGLDKGLRTPPGWCILGANLWH